MTTTLSVRRLAWAGVEIRLGDTRLLIDPLENVAPLAPVMGPPHRPVDPVDTPPGTHALITHLHPDHYDHDLIARIAATGTIGCHTRARPGCARRASPPLPRTWASHVASER
ncbi:MBL fold metallo-hydrolase [Streptacidiphilus sp. 4-A2]|nr:MBL fold metallo-hydrolase [Streptacidiphilus sp. 4-A2]